MIYVNFDKYGVLSTLELNDETIFKGSNRVNKIFVCFDGIELKPTHYLTYSALVNDYEYDGDLTDLASVRATYNGKDGYTFYLYSNLTAQAGTLKLSVRLVDRTTDEILVSGILPLIIQDTAVSTYASVDITTTQYNGLLVAIDELSQRINEIDVEEINGLKDKVDVIETSVRMLGTANNNLVNAVANLQEENRNQNDLINKQEKRIHTLELASEGNIIETIGEETTAYEYQLTGNTLPYATIDKLGGMTYKSDNLLVFDDILETTKNGITYKVENGVIIANGTATDYAAIHIYTKNNFNFNGKYYFKIFTNSTSYIDYGFKMRANNGADLKVLTYYVPAIPVELSNENAMFTMYINKGQTVSNFVVKPMLVNGTTEPTTYQKGFEGLRNSAVNKIISKGANLCSSVRIGGINESQANDPTRFTLLFNGSPYLAVEKGAKYQVGVFNNTVNYSQVYIRFTDENKTVLSDNNITLYENSLSTFQTITIPNNCSYIYIHAYNESAITLPTTAMVIKSETSPTEFKPYKEPSTKPIPQAIQNIDGYGLGINNEIYNYVDFENKKFIKKVVRIDLGLFTWEKDRVNNWLNVEEFNLKGKSTLSCLCSKYPIVSVPDNVDYGCRLSTSLFKVVIHDKDLINATASEFKNAMNGIYLYYEIETPLQADISTYIDNNLLEVEGGGTLVFENEHENAIPFAWTYQEKL